MDTHECCLTYISTAQVLGLWLCAQNINAQAGKKLRTWVGAELGISTPKQKHLRKSEVCSSTTHAVAGSRAACCSYPGWLVSAAGWLCMSQDCRIWSRRQHRSLGAFGYLNCSSWNTWAQRQDRWAGSRGWMQKPHRSEEWNSCMIGCRLSTASSTNTQQTVFQLDSSEQLENHPLNHFTKCCTQPWSIRLWAVLSL